MNFAFGKLQFFVRNKQPSCCCMGPHISLRHHMDFSRFIVVIYIYNSSLNKSKMKLEEVSGERSWSFFFNEVTC